MSLCHDWQVTLKTEGQHPTWIPMWSLQWSPKPPLSGGHREEIDYWKMMDGHRPTISKFKYCSSLNRGILNNALYLSLTCLICLCALDWWLAFRLVPIFLYLSVNASVGCWSFENMFNSFLIKSSLASHNFLHFSSDFCITTLSYQKFQPNPSLLSMMSPSTRKV